MNGLLIVIISWPDDPERGVEPYGPFATTEEQTEFVDDCIVAASLGYKLLKDAHYLMTTMPTPFDPRDLMP